MSTLVFDIETIGESWDSFDEITKKTLSQWIERTAKNEIEYQKELENVKTQLAFSPLTGFIVALGMYDVERALGAVYFVGDGLKGSEVEGEFTYKERTEVELLKEFWEGVLNYDTFVTFNGRAFDVPFLLHRSIAQGVRPSIRLSDRRYLSKQAMPYHIDLQDELTFYGAMNRRSPLHLFCRAYGIESPKSEVGGEDVAELFRQKKFRDIAHYNARDVIATTQLYEKWKQNLAPASFLNAIEF